MRLALTDLSIRQFPQPAVAAYYWDTHTAGLACRVSPKGVRTFVVLIGSGRRQTIGRFPSISLADARTEARRILAEKTLGKIRPKRVSFDTACDAFLKDCEGKNRPRTVADYTRLIRRHFRFGTMALSDITSHMILAKLRDLSKTPSERHHAFTAIRAFFAWSIRQHYIDRSPVENLETPANTPSRTRLLSEDELIAVYKAAQSMGYPFGHIVQLCILLGQRRTETALMRWKWIDAAGCKITFPAAITKNGHESTIPYGELVRGVLDAIPHTGDCLFPASRKHVRGKPTTVFAGWSKETKKLKQACGVDFRLHDLRRSFSSGMASLGVPLHVTEKLLNHVSGSISGVAAVYNRYSFMTEMRQAQTAWEAHLARLLRLPVAGE